MKKILLSFAVLGAFAFYSFHQREEENNVKLPLVPTSDVQPTTGDTPTSAPYVLPTSIPTKAQQSSKYKDGEFTGSVADAFYGPLQVKAVINGGEITDVQFLQYPNDRSTSREINGQAMPILKQEAISAQNAKVDVISGATQTSEAFVQTLQSALDKAI